MSRNFVEHVAKMRKARYNVLTVVSLTVVLTVVVSEPPWCVNGTKTARHISVICRMESSSWHKDGKLRHNLSDLALWELEEHCDECFSDKQLQSAAFIFFKTKHKQTCPCRIVVVQDQVRPSVTRVISNAFPSRPA